MNPLSLPRALVANFRGTVPRPSWCTYIVSLRCNARCGMCDSWRMKPGVELSVDDVAQVFEKIGSLDVVRLSGGEPFMREDFYDLALTVMQKSQPAVLHITSNGSYPDRVAKFAQDFPQPKKLRFMISLDGLKDEHDASRGKAVTFDLALKTIQNLVELRPRGLDVSVNHTVISEQSMRDSKELRAHLALWNVDVQSVLAYADSSMYGLKNRGKRAEHLIVPQGYPLHPKLEGTDVVGFVEGERTRANKLPLMLRVGKQYYLDGLRDRLLGKPNPSPKPHCVALRSHLRLMPNGDVPVCQFNTETVGNLLHQSFDDVWFGKKTTPLRQWVDSCPGCWAECEVMPSAIYSGDLLLHSIKRLGKKSFLRS